MLFLVILFFLVALFYSSVGFGGGSSYIALLTFYGISYMVIPKISLLCNILVVSGGCWHYYKTGLLDKKLVYPLVISSVPFAYLGGSFPISEKAFFILLGVCLLFCGIRILFLNVKESDEVKKTNTTTLCLVGAILGFISGMVGIGGGIFLSPIIINMGWARSKNAAAVSSAFILLNSISGLFGQLSKGYDFTSLQEFIPLFISVILGGQIGARIGTSSKVSYRTIQLGTGVLTLLVSLRLLFSLNS